ncbi:membrane protein [Mucinivorans hirudinis]|uniref:Membrane protein n=1 Tax=Mucinivorans hirudinis TaxID=1433126 RepID=A0A060R8J0_9BACT|nr:membrane protein [Mucinivorans hirudinis]
MEILHYAFIILIIGVIISYQWIFYRKTCKKQNELKYIFPDNCSETLDTIELEDSNTLIESAFHNPVFDGITNTINDYLRENKGAASDFHLIKDVVDRHCDAVEEEISTLTPIPLYCGLIGTMLGILIGVGILVFTGGIEDLLSTVETESGSGIVELLGGVSLAMISSIVGIILTTRGAYLTKEAKTKLNVNKNTFLSWIQVKLLPTLAGNTTSAIYTLQKNLSNFNHSFGSNIKEMAATFSSISGSQKDQLELMQLIERMDVSKIAKANVKVLEELQNSVREFERFNQYMHNVGNYLEKVERLNAEINDHLNRTKVIEDIGVFFKDEIQQIEQRKGIMNQTVGAVDTTIQNAVRRLQESTDQQLNEFIQYTVLQQERFSKTVTEQNEQFSSIILEQQNAAKKAIDTQEQILKSKLHETTAMIEELKNISAVKSSMVNIEKATNDQNKKLGDLIAAIERVVNSNTNGVVQVSQSSPKWMMVGVGVTLSILSIAGLLYIIPSILAFFQK